MTASPSSFEKIAHALTMAESLLEGHPECVTLYPQFEAVRRALDRAQHSRDARRTGALNEAAYRLDGILNVLYYASTTLH